MSGGGDGRACVWWTERDTCHDWLIGHRDELRTVQFIDEVRVLTAAADGTVRIWTPSSSATVEELSAELARRAPARREEQEPPLYVLGESPRAAP